MKNYKVLCNVDEVIRFDEPITIGCVTLYYKSNKLIAETSVYAESLPKAEKEGVSKIGKVVNVLSTELRCNVNYSLQTVRVIADGEVKNYANNDLAAELTIRVPFNPKMYSKIKRNNELADENKKVNKVFQLINFPDFSTWVGLYRVFEIIDKDSEVVTEGWMSNTKKSNFKRTANHPKASGNASRHGTPKSKKEVPPSNPMQLNEAEELIRDLVDKWLDKLAEK